MLKRLLYLYNDGHNPFPKLNSGGLGYHLPQYRKRMHGEAIHRLVDEDGELIDEFDDDNSDDDAVYEQEINNDSDDDEDDEYRYVPRIVGRMEKKAKANEDDDELPEYNFFNPEDYEDYYTINPENIVSFNPDLLDDDFYVTLKQKILDDKKTYSKDVIIKNIQKYELLIKDPIKGYKSTDKRDKLIDVFIDKKRKYEIQEHKFKNSLFDKEVLSDVTAVINADYNTSARSFINSVRRFLLDQKNDNKEGDQELFNNYSKLYKQIGDLHQMFGYDTTKTIEDLKKYLSDKGKKTNDLEKLFIESIKGTEETKKESITKFKRDTDKSKRERIMDKMDDIIESAKTRNLIEETKQLSFDEQKQVVQDNYDEIVSYYISKQESSGKGYEKFLCEFGPVIVSPFIDEKVTLVENFDDSKIIKDNDTTTNHDASKYCPIDLFFTTEETDKNGNKIGGLLEAKDFSSMKMRNYPDNESDVHIQATKLCGFGDYNIIYAKDSDGNFYIHSYTYKGKPLTPDISLNYFNFSINGSNNTSWIFNCLKDPEFMAKYFIEDKEVINKKGEKELKSGTLHKFDEENELYVMTKGRLEFLNLIKIKDVSGGRSLVFSIPKKKFKNYKKK